MVQTREKKSLNYLNYNQKPVTFKYNTTYSSPQKKNEKSGDVVTLRRVFEITLRKKLKKVK